MAALAIGSAVGCPGSLWAQTSVVPAPNPENQPQPSATQPPTAGGAQEPAPAASTPRGQIVIQSHGEAPSGPAGLPAAAPDPGQPSASQPAEDARPDVSDAERGSLTVTGYDLDLRLDREQETVEGRAQLVVHNDSQASLPHLPLQISSSLRWQSATLLDGAQRIALPLAQHRLDTDADHTGAAEEVVLTLPHPLAPGASARLDLFYTGSLRQNGDRLARLGASPAQQRDADWDAVSPSWTGLRGFGNVLWYPVASPQLFLADGNSLFLAIGQMRRREQAATVRLHLAVAYAGQPPAAAYFCGRRADLHALADDDAAGGSGLASADFPNAPLGFRLPSLFVVQQPESFLGGAQFGLPAASSPDDAASATGSVSNSNPSASAAVPSAADSAAPASPAPRDPILHARPSQPQGPPGEPILALATDDRGTAAGLGEAADRAAPLLRAWLGPQPISALTVLDHTGQPFQDGPLLVAPAAILQTSPEQPALTYSLTHAWVQTGQPWMDEGLAQFFALLDVERSAGRAAALAQMAGLLQPVALAEPNLTAGTDTNPGQPLITAADELFYRRKAAAVWWMLRDLAGEAPLRQALSAWRTQPESSAHPEAQAVAFQHLLERLSGKDLGWFFADWILRDRGLPDLEITAVETSATSASPTHNGGFLVAVTVRNTGGATADVPLLIQSGQQSTADRIRVPAFGQTTQRVLVQNPPTAVTVNDGSVPELTATTHTRSVSVQTTVN